MDVPNTFWQDLQDDLTADRDHAQQYLLESVRVSTVDRLVNQLEAERSQLGMSKAALARALHRDPASIRRLLSDTAGNPTIETISAVAAAMGLRLELVPMDGDERAAVAEPLQEMAGV